MYNQNIPFRKWTREEDDILTEMRQAGYTFYEIRNRLAEFGFNRTYDACASRWRTICNSTLNMLNGEESIFHENLDSKNSSKNNKETIIKLIRSNGVNNIKDICNSLSIDETEIYETIQHLKRDSLPISVDDNGNIFSRPTYISPNSRNIKTTILEKTITYPFTFAAISDTHIGSRACDYEALNYFYDYAHSLGVKHVLHAGDWVDGLGVYSGQEFEQDCIGFGQQANRFIERYPKRHGIKTSGICGNHDYSFIVKAGVDILDYISLRRSDINYCGIYQGIVQFGDIRIKLHHPDGGLSYAISYKMQKILETQDVDFDIFMMGHFHQCVVLEGYRNPLAIMPGSFQRETSFSTRKGLRNVIGGYIITVDHINDKFEFMTKWVDLN